MSYYDEALDMRREIHERANHVAVRSGLNGAGFDALCDAMESADVARLRVQRGVPNAAPEPVAPSAWDTELPF